MRVAFLSLLLLAGCTNDPTRGTFTQNVGAAFEECNPAEIRFLAGKHNFMSAFEPCGSNNFSDFAWSPDGTHLFFQLTQTAFIMNADAADKATMTLPTETPAGPGAWLTSNRVAVPVRAAEGATNLRMAVFDKDQKTLRYLDLPADLTDPKDLTIGDSPSQLLFSATKGGLRGVWAMDIDDGAVTMPWPWAGTVDGFTYEPTLKVAAVALDNTVTLYDATDGTASGSWSPATRGVLHPGSRWLALEHDGDAISIYYQRAWDELSDQARARELARAKKFEERLPEWYPKTVNPPTISLVDLTTDGRWIFTGFQGHHFSWYTQRDYYASFVLWGFEGKEFNRNVMLGNLADRMRSIERGEEMLGVKRWETPGVPADAPPAEEAPPSPENTP